MNDTLRSPLRVLVVDDDADTVVSEEILLRMWGHEVSVARSGPDAVALATQCQPDVVLLDLALPEMDGFQIADALRSQVSSPLMIAVSGFGREQDVARCQRAGFHLHFLKPVDPDCLQLTLQKFAAVMRRRRRNFPTKTVRVGVANPALSTIKYLDLLWSLRDAQIAYELFSRKPPVFGWVMAWNRELTDEERTWLHGHGFVQVAWQWYKRDV